LKTRDTPRVLRGKSSREKWAAKKKEKGERGKSWRDIASGHVKQKGAQKTKDEKREGRTVKQNQFLV